MSDAKTQTTILDWYATGEKGISSETMASCAIGRKYHRPCHPLDPSDLNRCIKLVDTAPEVKLAFPDIAKLSPEWKTVIDHWDELREMFIAEVGYDWSRCSSAEKTYYRMKELGL